LPALRKKRATVDITLAAAVLLDSRGRTLLVRQKNGDGALFSRMWQFPAVESNVASTNVGEQKVLSAHLLEKFGMNVVSENLVSLAAARHAVTYRNIRLKPYLIRVARLPRVPGARIVALSKVRGLPVSNATQKIADAAIADGIK
jgi:adenine-specific DNA glycosylase